MNKEKSITNRLNIPIEKLIYDDFPKKARIAVAYLFLDLVNKRYIWDEESVLIELRRIGRVTKDDFEGEDQKGFINKISNMLYKLDWVSVLSFIERTYEKFLSSVYDSNEEYHVSLEVVKKYFSDEINLIITEENLGFEFIDGMFSRRYKYQTLKLINQANKVLDNPELDQVRKHYKKALNFFNKLPQADFENCIKEAICSFEASLEILFSVPASNDFDKAIRKIQGNDDGKIPGPIIGSMIKIHSIRGSSQGVAHASTKGNRISPSEAELVLSLIAAYITYLDDICIKDTDIPF
ncbi:MAG: hypothetical protein Q8N39_10840 [Pelolinea sp.]|nr:hypothetical protein [Pelolinea sp.]